MSRTSSAETLRDAAVVHAAAEAVRKAYATGLLQRSPDIDDLDMSDVLDLANRLHKHGIATRATSAMLRQASSDPETVTQLLRDIDARLEESPLPDTEWPRLLEVLDRDLLARLLGISASSVARYASGERRTPDDVAARVHFLALVAGDLAGAYNEIGVRRWFDRRRTALNGATPASRLRPGWQPEDEGPARVRQLARALVTSPGA